MVWEAFFPGPDGPFFLGTYPKTEKPSVEALSEGPVGRAGARFLSAGVYLPPPARGGRAECRQKITNFGKPCFGRTISSGRLFLRYVSKNRPRTWFRFTLVHSIDDDFWCGPALPFSSNSETSGVRSARPYRR